MTTWRLDGFAMVARFNELPNRKRSLTRVVRRLKMCVGSMGGKRVHDRAVGANTNKHCRGLPHLQVEPRGGVTSIPGRLHTWRKVTGPWAATTACSTHDITLPAANVKSMGHLNPIPTRAGQISMRTSCGLGRCSRVINFNCMQVATLVCVPHREGALKTITFALLARAGIGWQADLDGAFVSFSIAEIAVKTKHMPFQNTCLKGKPLRSRIALIHGGFQSCTTASCSTTTRNRYRLLLSYAKRLPGFSWSLEFD